MEKEEDAIKRIRLELILEGCIEGKEAPDDWIKHVQANRNTLEHFHFIFDEHKLKYTSSYKGKQIEIDLRDVLLDTMDITYMIYYCQEKIDKGKDLDIPHTADLIRKGFLC